MNSQLADSFVEAFGRLPEAIKNQARKSYQVWRQNPTHRSLHFKKIHAHENLYSVRIGQGWRALGLLDGNTITWFWIGSHANYEKLIS